MLPQFSAVFRLANRMTCQKAPVQCRAIAPSRKALAGRRGSSYHGACNSQERPMMRSAIRLQATAFLASALAVAVLSGAAQAQAEAQTPALDPQNTILLETKDGTVTIKLRPDLAPKHVVQIKTLTKQGFYDGIVFHRVITGFMAQTGDPTGTGGGRSELPNIPAEFTPEPYKRGSLGMARSSSPDSANSQFFICYDGCGSLTGSYTIWGEVVSGMAAVDKIKKGSQSDNGKVTAPDKIIRMRLMADAK
jgi:cyclophilin family peptidyl-prolyl cis-trans isomerase